MATRLNPERIDLRALAQSGETLSADDALALFPRLAGTQAGTGSGVRWSALAEWRRPMPGLDAAAAAGGAAQQPVLWLHLQAQATVDMTCQRCLGPAPQALETDRWFRFVADEATADAEDEDSEEDVLVFSQAFNLRELVEDELIMAQPLVPMHETCPTPLVVRDAAPPAEASAERPHPFAALAQLKKKP